MSIALPSYMALSLRYCNADGARVNVTYPESSSVVFPETDIGGVVSHFLNLNEFYLLGVGDGKRYVTFVAMDENDESIDTALMFILALDEDVLMSGRPIIKLMSLLKEMVSSGLAPDNTAVIALIERAGFPVEPLRGNISEVIGCEKNDGMCYRTFVSSSELNAILSFPNQKAYESYASVVVTHATAASVPGDSLLQITEPVHQAFTVVCPDGVTASASAVELSDKLSLTYSCCGYDSQTVNFEVGTTNRYVKMSGPALIVSNAERAGIVFSRGVPYAVTSEDNVPVANYTILVNGRTATRHKNTFEVSSADFAQSGKVYISVSSTNFLTASYEFTPEELFAIATLEVVLAPEMRKILLRLDFDDRVIESYITIEKNSPEYCNLRAGFFHGFRAHRVLGRDTDTYNVEMSAPVENVKNPSESNLSSDAVVDSLSRRQPENNSKTPTDISPKEKSEETDSGEAGKSHVAIWVSMAFVALAVAAAVVWYALDYEPSAVAVRNADDVTANAVKPDSAVVADTVPVLPISVDKEEKNSSDALAAEKTDLDYLNGNRVWRRSDLKSEKYLQFYDLLATGDIDAIVSCDYFAVQGMASNPLAINIADLLWQAKGTGTQRSNIKVMTDLSGREQIDLKEVYESLSRKKDKTPNPEPRPQR